MRKLGEEPVPQGDWLVQASGDRERRILNIIDNLCQDLSLKIKPTRVAWARYLFPGEFSYDFEKSWHAYFLLPETLKTKLEVEEWRPLLASFLIFERKLFRRLLLNILALIVVTVPTLFLTAIFFIATLGTDLGLGLWLLFCLGLGGLMTMLSVRQRVKLKLLADRRAAELVGKTSLLGVLSRIQENSRERQENGLRRVFSSKLSARQRITHLNSQRD